MIWHWIIFILMLFLIPIGIAEFKVFAYKYINCTQTEEQKKIANQNMAKYMIFYWLCDIFYLACFNNWLIMKFIIGILLMIIVFYSLTVSFLSSTPKNFILKFGFIQDFIIGIGLSIYLIYIIPCDEIKEIVIPIVSALYGGLLTLVGVAWTIKQNDSDRKNEKRLSVKPLIYPLSCRSDYDYENAVNLEFIKDDKSKIQNIIGVIENSDNGILIIESAIINGEEYKLFNKAVIAKNKAAHVLVYTDKKIQIETLYIIGKDVLGNTIKYKLTLNKEKHDIDSIIEEE